MFGLLLCTPYLLVGVAVAVSLLRGERRVTPDWRRAPSVQRCTCEDCDWFVERFAVLAALLSDVDSIGERLIARDLYLTPSDEYKEPHHA